MVRQRVQIRFRKSGEVRLIGHLDLIRTFERLFRRINLKLSMTEGFHPKPRMRFPAPLALGILAERELMELELSDRPAADELLAALQDAAPSGLEFVSVEMLGEGFSKPRVRLMTYRIEVPAEKLAEVEKKITEFNVSESVLIYREGRERPIDVCESLTQLVLKDGVLKFGLRNLPAATPRPADILNILGIGDLLFSGHVLTRTDVLLETA